MGLETAKGAQPSAAGPYELLEKIAEGGMGAIYRARHTETGQVVAIKVMPANTANNPVLLKRFEQEFRAASRLDHPNVVRALDYGESANQPYLVMEYVEGESLGQKIEREGRMSEAEAIRIIAQVAQGLHRAHKHNLIHRDVKPDNILIRTDGVAKLADLGLVKETETDLNLTRTGRGLGTPHFMAPEQFRNAKGADVLCDIYSLGATLYMMVTGELPFKSNGPLDAWMKKIQNDLVPPRQLVKGLTERVNWAILRAMSADRDQRPRTCREFVEDLTGHSTRRLPGTGSSASAQQDMWYLVYKDEDGNQHTVKGTTAAIRRSLKEGLLGDASNVRASRAKTGPFEGLREHPEFRDLLVTAAPLPVLPSARPDPGAATRPPAGDATQPPRPAPAADGSTTEVMAPPHIALDEETPAPAGGVDWLKWMLLAALTLASAAVAFWLLPARWWR